MGDHNDADGETDLPDSRVPEPRTKPNRSWLGRNWKKVTGLTAVASAAAGGGLIGIGKVEGQVSALVGVGFVLLCIAIVLAIVVVTAVLSAVLFSDRDDPTDRMVRLIDALRGRPQR
jgi:hypothetical protein